MIKVGTVKELTQYEGKIDPDVYRSALRIVTVLDEVYGTERDVDNADGGFVLIATSVQDAADISKRYVALDGGRHESVDVMKCESGAYINTFFLCNNEFGINVFMPLNIAPSALLSDLLSKNKKE